MDDEKMMLRAVKKTRIYEEVVTQIRELIREGRLKAGDKLPPERELAETFRVSRTSVREAIRALETQGFVISRPGAGTFISADRIEAIIQPMASLLFQGRDELADIFEMRRLIEPHIASLAADRATSDDLTQMRETLEEQKLQINRGETGVEADTNFHLAIAQATQNRALFRLVSAIVDILSQSREKSLQVPNRPQKSLASHHEILTAIERHNPEKAREAMQRHIEEVEVNVFALEGHE
ncbi:MAG: FadR family transcriptional regulator [Candidatus Tectomicrobia bacterium]|nr:FadR family transcriptional regulator [Candidatus Tectomicrobia bacterium]